MRVLLAMGPSDERERIRSSLWAGGFDDVREAACSQDAIAALDGAGAQASPADVVLLDMALEDADGVETCANIRLLPGHRETPIVVMASPGDVQSLSQAFVAGASDYLFRPFHDVELLARMRSIARNKVQFDRRRGYERELQRLRRPGSIWRGGEGPALDSETGLPGRHVLTESLNWHGQREDGARIAVIVAQIDALTSYRHLCGPDETSGMLRRVTTALGREPASLDRYLIAFDTGSFAIVAAPSDDSEFQRADALRRRVLDLRIPHMESALRETLSVSVGLSCGRRSGREAVSQLLPNAIRAAEQAAAEGGNRVVCVDDMT